MLPTDRRSITNRTNVVRTNKPSTKTGHPHTESQTNSLTCFEDLLIHQAAKFRMLACRDSSGQKKTICLILVPYIDNAICETPGHTPTAWIRRGTQNVPMTLETRDRIRVEKGIVDFEHSFCTPFYAEDLAEDVLVEFRKVYHPASPTKLSTERLLYEAGAIVRHNGDYWFTHAGLLFFASNPQRALPGAHIRLLRFDLSCDQYRDRGLPTFDQQFSGPLTTQIRSTRTFFRESAFFKRYQKRKPGGGFTEEPELPPSVIDEALVNAIAHRDYQTPIPIECERYTDALIVKNPGRIRQRNTDLPDEFSLAENSLDSTPRNPQLLAWLKLMQDPSGTAYVQAISEGTKQMLAEMTHLALAPPRYRLAENETMIRLDSNAEAREAALLAANRVQSTEFANLYLLRVRRGHNTVTAGDLNVHYRQLVSTLRDVLVANRWHIDRCKFSRIIAHRKGTELDLPVKVKPLLRMYPAYEFQIRQYFDQFYLCLDYKCQVRNIQRLSVVGKHLPQSSIVGRHCVAKTEEWREGRIVEFDMEFATVQFSDTETEEHISTDSIIPSCSLAMIQTILQHEGVSFNLAATLKKHSLSSRSGLAKERSRKIDLVARHVADRLFPLQFGDLEINILTEPVQLSSHTRRNGRSFLVRRLSEPTVEFRERRSSADVRSGITKFGAYDDAPHNIRLFPVCTTSLRSNMEELIERLKFGSHRYKGSERTFATKFSYSAIITVDQVEDAGKEINRILKEQEGIDTSEYYNNENVQRIFLVHTPEHGYSSDDHTAPYYVIKRQLLEYGMPCQMVDTPTLKNPDWKDLNLALNIIAKCGVRPWVLPDRIPEADFFIGLSYTQSRDGRRIMGFTNVFNSYGKWEFYSGNTSYFDFKSRTQHLARLVKDTLRKLRSRLSPTPRVVLHYSAKLSRRDQNAILAAARGVRPGGIFTFVWINTHHNVRFYDNRPETDGSLRRGSYVVAGSNKIYLSTTGYNQFRHILGTPKPLEITSWISQPNGLPRIDSDLRVLATQVLNLTKLNWASTDSFCGTPITLKYARDIAYLTAAFLRISEPFQLHPNLESTPWFI